ncbi:MAG TPA: SDR family NAD(P)-dependent oxidoreductase [Bacteroidales bacterium]|nr:SDR family NAD(P)-dependent oxidoreductase [Bacteroidales bacterium]
MKGNSPHYENYIISGIGYALGRYPIDNDVIAGAVDHGFLSGFDASRIKESDAYQQALEAEPGLHPFSYMAAYLMGFRTRYYVVPFPPVASRYKHAENSLDLCVKAVEAALTDSGVHAEQIDAWMVSTATPHEQAPGMAETLKGFFTGYQNKKQCMTITSACVGFNYNIERALCFFKAHPEARHVVVAHSEVMSELLVNETDFVPFVTFGDSAAAVVVSRIDGKQKEGIIDVENGEDLQMIDFLGANRKGDLYMNPRMVKRRAVPNITRTASNLAEKLNISAAEADWFIPHQTGNAIVHEVAKNLDIIPCRLFQEVQYSFGNLSGASVPVAIAKLKSSGRLKPGQKLITAVAGLGGEYGGFSYIVPNFDGFNCDTRDLKGKTAILTGSTGGLGSAIAAQLACRGANLILQYNSGNDKIKNLQKLLTLYPVQTEYIQADFSHSDSVIAFAETILNKHKRVDYLIHTAAVSGKVDRSSNISSEDMQFAWQVNTAAAIQLNETLAPVISETILFTGSVAEDAQFSGSSPYVASKKALHSYAVEFASKAYRNGIRCIYYMPGIIDGGMGDLLDKAQKNAAMLQIKQPELIDVNAIADRMVRSLYLPKVINTRNIYENKLLVRKDGYFAF